MKRASAAARPGAADEAAVEADRHLGAAAFALRIEHIRGVFEIGEELVAGIEALRRGETHVVGFERIGNDEERRAVEAFTQ